MGPDIESDDPLVSERQMQLLARNVFRVIATGAVVFTAACLYVLGH